MKTTYNYCGIAYLCLKEWQEAKADLTTAKNTGVNTVASFQKDRSSVAVCEEKTVRYTL